MPQKLAFAGNPKMKNFQDVYLQTPNHLVPSLHITVHFNFTLNIPNTLTQKPFNSYSSNIAHFFLCETKAKAFRCNFILHSLSCPTTDPLNLPSSYSSSRHNGTVQHQFWPFGNFKTIKTGNTRTRMKWRQRSLLRNKKKGFLFTSQHEQWSHNKEKKLCTEITAIAREKKTGCHGNKTHYKKSFIGK